MFRRFFCAVAAAASFYVSAGEPPSPPGPEGWRFRAVLAEPEELPPVDMSRVEFIRGKVDGFESYRIDVAENGSVKVTTEDDEGLRRAKYYVADRLRAGDLRSCVRKPWLKNRISRCFFGPIKRPPFNRDELMDDIDYYPAAYLERLAREGVNGLWLTVEFDDLAETSLTPRPKDAERRFAKLNRTVEKCLEYGIKTWIFAIEPKSRMEDSALYKAHPELFGDANIYNQRTMCTSHPDTLRYLEEATRDIFRHVPKLGGLINISHGERWTSCLSHWSAVEGGIRRDVTCACRGRQPCDIHCGTVGAMAKGMRSVNPKAELISWFYQPDASVNRSDWVYDCAGCLPEGVKFLYNFESGLVVNQAGRWRVPGDYWLSLPGPGVPFKELAARSAAAGRSLAAKIQVCTSHEDATVPYVPAPGLLYRKFKGIKACGVDTAMLCWYFGNYPGLMNQAAGELAFETFADGEEAFLERLAKPVWGDKSRKMMELWRAFSQAYANYPASQFTQYYGPAHAGVAWPLYPYVELRPVQPTWKADRKPSGDAVGDSLGDLTLDEAMVLMDRMADLPEIGLCGETPVQREVLDVMKALKIQFESARNIYSFYRHRREALASSREHGDAATAREHAKKMAELLRREKANSAAMIPLCEANSALGFHSEAEAHLFFPANLRWRLVELDRAERELAEIDAALARGETYPLSAFEKAAPVIRLGAWTDGKLGTRFRLTRDEDGAWVAEGEVPSAVDSVTVSFYDAAGAAFPAEYMVCRSGKLAGRWIDRETPKDTGRVTVTETDAGWKFRLRADFRDAKWVYFHFLDEPLWPRWEKGPRHRLYFEEVDGTAFGRIEGLPAADRMVLAENGVAKCHIVVAENASLPEKFGARELAKYLELVSGAKFCVTTPASGIADLPVVSIDVKSHPALKEDGFAIEVTPERMAIVGRNPRGALYGCYEVLKRWAGMRWVTPGEDGEYFVPRKTITASVGRLVKNPYLTIRETRGDDSDEGRLWSARNNLLTLGNIAAFYDPKTMARAKTADRYEELCVRGIGATGHLMSTLLLDSNSKADAEKLFAVHPEYFPLVGGKRVLTWTHNSPNPCISVPEVLDIMAANLLKRIPGPHGCESYCEIGNNDTSVWCECERCRALDAPEAKGTRGELSDRYWWMMNELGKRVWAKSPDARLCGAPYQNFWYAPLHVKPDPRLYVFVSFNNQCWRHSVMDPKCTVNKTMRDIFNGFKNYNMPLVFNRDEIGAWDGQGSPGCEFQPAESVLAKNFLEYPQIGCNGSHFCVPGPFPAFSNFAKNWAPYYGKRYHWYAMWQTCYVASLMMWDPTVDWEKELEIANRYYYGAAWEGGMKEFRALHKSCFFEAPGCVGWGQNAPMGRCLDAVGSEAKLKELLEKAIASAAAANNERALMHAQREKAIFELTWLVQRKAYLENFKELSVYKRQSEIKIDGVLDEADWKNTDALSDFRISKNVVSPHETSVRVTYDADHLYLALTAMEKTPEKMIIGEPKPDATDVHELGDRLELFYNYPDMSDAAYHLCVNAKGFLMAARQNSTSDRVHFKTSAKWATKVYPDRWTLEIAIPCNEVGQQCFDGGTWKLNVARERLTTDSPRCKDGSRMTESSSCCRGVFHGPANFLNVKFTPERAKGMSQGCDVSGWKNANFDRNRKLDLRDKARYKGYVAENDREPADWNVMDVVGEYHRKTGSDADWYFTLRYGPTANLRQYFFSDGAARLKAIVKARGKGKLNLWTGSFELTPDKKDYKFKKGTEKSFSFDLAPDWKVFTAEVDKEALPVDRVMFRFSAATPESEVELDDVVVTPIK